MVDSKGMLFKKEGEGRMIRGIPAGRVHYMYCQWRINGQQGVNGSKQQAEETLEDST